MPASTEQPSTERRRQPSGGGPAGDGARDEPTPAHQQVAARGSALHCRGWPQEAAWRMLHNNLDPAVAERPEDLVVYGGSGKAARDWPSFDAICPHPPGARRRRDPAGPVGPARRRAPDPRVGAPGPDRQQQPGRRLGQLGRVPPPRALGLTMYGQMTAGSWIYIGTQGILQGTYETFAAIADRALRRLAGRARSPSPPAPAAWAAPSPSPSP